MKSDTLILHHYESSPYAEKIRLMLGAGGLKWYSVLSPAMPPRPHVDPLTGGYRRIPVAQLGADIFCDTTLIAREVAWLASNSAFNPEATSPSVGKLVQRAQGDVFFSAITGVPPHRLLWKLLRLFGPIGALRFMKDRSGMMSNATINPPQGAAAAQLFDEFLGDLDAALSGCSWLSGTDPGYADFAVYHPLWLRVRVGGEAIAPDYPHVVDWFARVSAIGHGEREELEAAQAFMAARESEPRALPDSEAGATGLGKEVAVTPGDYGREPVRGILVALTADRVIVARDTDDFGRVHVHFPRDGYEVTLL